MAERNAAYRDLAEVGVGASLHYGGNLVTVDNHPLVNGLSSAAEAAAIDASSDAIVPFASIVRRLAFRSTAAGTSVLTLYRNGTTTSKTWTLPGATSGILLLDSSAEESCLAGNTLSIRITTVNTAPGAATYQILLERYLL